MNQSDKNDTKMEKDVKIFHLKETNDIIVLNETTKWWDNFHINKFAEYVKKKYRYHLSKINMN